MISGMHRLYRCDFRCAWETSELRPASGDMIFHITWSSDGNFVAGGAEMARPSLEYIHRGTRNGCFWDEYEGDNWRLNGIRALQFSPDNQLLWSASGDGTIRSWNMLSGDEYRTWNLGEAMYAQPCNQNGTQLAYTREDGNIEITDTLPTTDDTAS